MAKHNAILVAVVAVIVGLLVPSYAQSQSQYYPNLQSQWDQMRTHQMMEDMKRQVGRGAPQRSSGGSCKESCGAQSLQCLTSNTPQRVCNAQLESCNGKCP
jgi:hypothetical protein